MRNQGEGFPTFPSPSTFHLFNPSLSFQHFSSAFNPSLSLQPVRIQHGSISLQPLSLSSTRSNPARLFSPSLSLQPVFRTSKSLRMRCSLFSLTLQWSTCLCPRLLRSLFEVALLVSSKPLQWSAASLFEVGPPLFSEGSQFRGASPSLCLCPRRQIWVRVPRLPKFHKNWF